MAAVVMITSKCFGVRNNCSFFGQGCLAGTRLSLCAAIVPWSVSALECPAGAALPREGCDKERYRCKTHRL